MMANIAISSEKEKDGQQWKTMEAWDLNGCWSLFFTEFSELYK